MFVSYIFICRLLAEALPSNLTFYINILLTISWFIDKKALVAGTTRLSPKSVHSNNSKNGIFNEIFDVVVYIYIYFTSQSILLWLVKYTTATLLFKSSTYIVNSTTRFLVKTIQIITSTKKVVVTTNKVAVAYFTNLSSWVNQPFILVLVATLYKVLSSLHGEKNRVNSAWAV